MYQTKNTPRTSYPGIYSFRYVQKFIKFLLGFFLLLLLVLLLLFWNPIDWFDSKPEQNSSEQPVLVDILFQTH